AALKVNPQDNDTFQRLQYAQSMLAKKNASPPPAASPSPTPTPEKPSLIASIKPLYVGIGIVALIIIAVIVRLLTRGKPEGTSRMIGWGAGGVASAVLSGLAFSRRSLGCAEDSALYNSVSLN